VILSLLADAQRSGARLSAACRVLGLSARTVERWQAKPDGDDGRLGPRSKPRHELTAAERARVVEVLTKPEHAGLSPKQLVPKLADQGVYLASESTLYRVRRQLKPTQTPRDGERKPVTRASRVHRATGPNQVWSWDITYLPSLVRGRYFYLYLVMDVWSRCIVGWTVAENENASIASDLIQRICDSRGVDAKGLVLHSDNGRPMRGATMIATLQWLGIVPSFSRPHVSNDNPYSEALFRTLKYTPAYPQLPFADIESARAWLERFVEWYNREHRHSAIRYVTPEQRHSGHESQILARRHELYRRARHKHPRRWTTTTRNWTPVGAVLLNPEPTSRTP
jgi:putative transposase